MAQTMVNFRIDEDVKRKMESDSFYSESNIRVLEERAANIESGKSIPKEHELIEVQRMGMFWEDEAWREGTQQFFHVKTIMGISNIEWWEKKSSIFFIFLWTFRAHRK